MNKNILDGLPEIPIKQIELLCDLDYYDGPLNGIARYSGRLHYFEWTGMDDSESSYSSPRSFTLHPLPADDELQTGQWISRSNELSDEYRLLVNGHMFPMTFLQRSILRSEKDIDADIRANNEKMPEWKHLPAAAWFCESGSSDFAAIQTFVCTKEQSEQLPIWQKAVARSLCAEDQGTLSQLFADPPLAVEEKSLFVSVQKPHRVPETADFGIVDQSWPGKEPVVKCIVCDNTGQILTAPFLIRADHMIQILHADPE